VPVLQTIIGHNMDVIIGYSLPSGFNFFNAYKSDELKETTYHELTHAAHYAKLGSSWYTQFLNSEVTGIVNNVFNTTYSPYGNGGASYSPIIALGESWAYYMGHFMADLRYGSGNSSQQIEQGIGYQNNSPVTSLSSHLNLLEDFNPSRTGDPFHWIPQGIFYDLSDSRNDILFSSVAVSDQVSGYTNQQMFNTFQSTIYSLQDYRIRLLQTTTNSTSAFVPNLFTQYGY